MITRLLLIVILLFIYNLTSIAGTIEGKVIDAQTGEELVGATIFIQEIKKGTSTGLDGTFAINGIPNGKYTIECSYISYEGSKQTIEIKSNETIVLNIPLKITSKEIEQVVVKSNDIGSTEIGAKITEKQAIELKNVISAKTIELSPDINIANVVQRLSGVMLDKNTSGMGQYALLRGMDKRYNYTLINGIKIPSTHNKHRYISLELFPSDMVERVEVTKALTPDFEGDAIGGVVNLVMKRAPSNFSIQASTAVGYNLFFEDNNFLTFNKNKIQPQSPYERFGKGYLAKPDDFSRDNLVIKENKIPLNNLANITIGDRFFSKRLGVLFSSSYQKNYSGTKSLYYVDDLSRDGKNLPLLTNMQERTYFNNRQNIGTHTYIDYILSNNNDLSLYLAYIYMDNVQIRELDKTDLTVSYDPLNGNIIKTHSSRLRFNMQSLTNATLQGRHHLSDNLKMQWSVVTSLAQNRTPEEATITYSNNIVNFMPTNQYVDFDGSSRIWRRNTDNDKAAYINFRYASTILQQKTNVHFGGMYRIKHRVSFYNKYTLKAVAQVNNPDSSYLSFYSEKGKDWQTYDQIVWQVYNPRGTIAVGENYEASEEVVAGYVMFNVDIDKLTLTSGIRIENTTQGYNMEYPIGEPFPSGSTSYLEFLPSIHVKYQINEKNYLRASYYKALNKPGFQEIVPYIDTSEEPSEAGNKSLKHAIAHNIDLRFEYFPDGLDQFMIGLFYKKLINPIEFAFEKHMNVSQNVVYTPINTDKALNLGMEIDIVQFFRQWGIRTNYTTTYSNIVTNKLARIKNENGNDSTIYIKQQRPLFGQSAHVGNVSLLYRNVNRGINLQLAFSYTGERIYTVSRFIDNDLWQIGYYQLDLSGEKNYKNGFSIFFKVNNILNSRTQVYIKKTNPVNYDVPYQDSNNPWTLVRDEFSGTTFLIGVRYKF